MGGGGGQKTTSESKYPPEFAPLADSARKEIEALQRALPLVSHAGFQPAGVAGLSPVEQFTINELVMRTPYLPASFESLMQMPEPVGAASRSAYEAGRGSKGAAGSLDYLSEFLGRDVRPAPASTAPFQVLTRWPTPETAFPGLSAATLEAARPGIATQPTPMIQPIPAAPSLPPPAPVSQADLTNAIAQPVPPGYVRVPAGFSGGHVGEVIPLSVWEVWATMPGVPLEQVMAIMADGGRSGLDQFGTGGTG